MSASRPSFPARLSSFGPASGVKPAGLPKSSLPEPPRIAAGALRGPAAARDLMVQRLQRLHGIRSEPVLQAMSRVERHRFVDSALAGQAYEDTSLPIGFGQTISKPQVVARMLQILLDKPLPAGSKVLEIGTGCGYQAAVLAQLFGSVYSIERIGGLHQIAHKNLLALHASGAPVANIHLLHGDGMLGYARGGPYHAIIAAAGGAALPQAWLEQLAPGGRLIAPVEQGPQRGQALVLVDKDARGQVNQQVLDTVHFVPLKSGAST